MMITHSIYLTQYDYLSIKQLKRPLASYLLTFAVTVKFHGSHEQHSHFLHISPSILTGSKEQLQKVPKKRFFLHIFEINRLKYTIPKFEMFRVEINDFTSLQSCAILPSKMVKGMGPS